LSGDVFGFEDDVTVVVHQERTGRKVAAAVHPSGTTIAPAGTVVSSRRGAIASSPGASRSRCVAVSPGRTSASSEIAVTVAEIAIADHVSIAGRVSITGAISAGVHAARGKGRQGNCAER
jgi:hypothetical protein